MLQTPLLFDINYENISYLKLCINQRLIMSLQFQEFMLLDGGSATGYLVMAIPIETTHI